MTAADVTTYVETGLPSIELAVLELTDGETYESLKFSTVLAAIPFWMVDTDGDINATVSGTTVTINAVGASDSAIGVLVFGVH